MATSQNNNDKTSILKFSAPKSDDYTITTFNLCVKRISDDEDVVKQTFEEDMILKTKRN